MENSVYDKIKKFCEDNGIVYKEIKHAPGASAEDYHNALGCRYEQQLKCLLLKIYAETEYFAILTIPAQKRADLETIKTLASAKKVRMATKDELKEVTGCNFGELPPIGSIFQIKLFMDKDFLNETEVYLNAGKVDISFVINSTDLQKAENPIMV